MLQNNHGLRQINQPLYLQNRAQDKAEEAGVRIVGGHSIDDNEPKFGLAVTGIIHPTKVLSACSTG